MGHKKQMTVTTESGETLKIRAWSHTYCHAPDGHTVEINGNRTRYFRTPHIQAAIDKAIQEQAK